MRCSDSALWIARKLDGLLTEDEAAELQAHLRHCSRCRAELALQKKLIHSLKQESPGEVSPDFTRRVSRRAADLGRLERRRRFRVTGLLPAILPVAAAVVLILLSRDLMEVMTPAIDSLVITIAGPLAAVAEPLSNLLSNGAAGPSVDMPCPGWVSALIANVYFAVAVALAAVTWAFTKAYALMNR
jgi:anti-sigma factor RsiW